MTFDIAITDIPTDGPSKSFAHVMKIQAHVMKNSNLDLTTRLSLSHMSSFNRPVPPKRC